MAGKPRVRPFRDERGLSTLELSVLSVVLGIAAAICIQAYLIYQ